MFSLVSAEAQPELRLVSKTKKSQFESDPSSFEFQSVARRNQQWKIMKFLQPRFEHKGK